MHHQKLAQKCNAISRYLRKLYIHKPHSTLTRHSVWHSFGLQWGLAGSPGPRPAEAGRLCSSVLCRPTLAWRVAAMWPCELKPGKQRKCKRVERVLHSHSVQLQFRFAILSLMNRKYQVWRKFKDLAKLVKSQVRAIPTWHVPLFPSVKMKQTFRSALVGTFSSKNISPRTSSALATHSTSSCLRSAASARNSAGISS